MAGTAGTLVAEAFHNFFINWKLLLKEYRAPENLQQLATFTKTTLNMENYKRSLSTRA
jgi:solute carrier family 25 (mitochondrial oxoglutarate transporter), member 11